MIRVRPQQRGQFSHRSLSADLKEFALGCGQLLESIIKEEACMTARMAMRYAPPMSAPVRGRNERGEFSAGGGAGGDGDTSDSRKWGEVAVQTSVRMAVKTVDESLLSATSDFSNVNDYIKWKAAKGNSTREIWLTRIVNGQDEKGNTFDEVEQYKKLKAIFHKRNSVHRPLDTGGLASWHRKIKREWGHKYTKRKGFFSWSSQAENQRFADEATIRSYVRTAVEKVGWVKSGWVQCIKQIGPVKMFSKKYPMGQEKVFGLKGLPKYITRHTGYGRTQMNVPSLVDPKATSAEFRINIMNMVGNAGNNAGKAKVIENVLRARRFAREKKVAKYARLFDRAASKFNTGA